MGTEDNLRNVKAAIGAFDEATRPTVKKVFVGLSAALQTAQGSVDKIADAANRLAMAQADLAASTSRPASDIGASPKRARPRKKAP